MDAYAGACLYMHALALARPRIALIESRNHYTLLIIRLESLHHLLLSIRNPQIEKTLFDL
jgi:hypothetical protein